VPQDEIEIGVPAYRDPREVGLTSILALPFGEERPTWRLSGVGPEVNHRDTETQLKTI
jgi:hypothetical protein